MRRILVLTVACGVVLGGASPALAATSTAAGEHAGSEHAGSERAGSERAGSERAGGEQAGGEQAAPRACSAAFYDGDSRLGPRQLPVAGRVGREVWHYRRTGDRTVAGFLSTYYDSATGSWRYPPDNGYVIRHGKPVEFHARLRDGRRIDRFGSEYGSFLAPQGLRYAARSIPPASLDGTPAAGCNYHDYEVTKPFTVDAGPIAAWFAQPGGGRQYQLDATLIPGAPARINVMWLVANGYLRRIV